MTLGLLRLGLLRLELPWLGLLLLTLLCLGSLAAQEKAVPGKTIPEQQSTEPWGKTVQAIEIIPPTVEQSTIRAYLKTQVGKPLRKANIEEDLTVLWNNLEIRARAEYVPVKDGVQVFLYVLEEAPHFDRVEIKGNKNMTRDEVRTLLGLSSQAVVSSITAERYRLILRERYKRDGFYFVHIKIKADEEASVLTFFIDEGPKVSVESVKFRGNKSFPASKAFFGAGLIEGAKLEGRPRVYFNGEPYSDVAIEDDVEKLRIFYRQNGYLDARVQMEERAFSEDRSKVYLTYRVIEGERYRVSAVELVQQRSENQQDMRPPLYSHAEVFDSIELKPGSFYNARDVRRDMAALENFYGKRGHATRGRFGMVLPKALLQVLEPSLVFDLEKSELKVVYTVVEGTPKQIREVRIKGNTYTQDRVIRRDIKLFPGDRLDISLLDRSRRLLDSRRYFQDPRSLSGVRMELKPVEADPDQVDLDVTVQEGETGSFIWGAGVSTASGVQGNIIYNKRNFDLFKLPSSWNPITIFSEIIDSKAFHGGGQELDMIVSPGTEISTGRITWSDPDLFREHVDTIGGRVSAFRQFRRWETFRSDAIGGSVGLSRIVDENMQVRATLRHETIELEELEFNAPTIIFENEGSTEIRSLELSLFLSDLDDRLSPREGYRIRAYAELVGGPFGGGQNYFKLGTSAEGLLPIYEDSLQRKHVLFSKFQVDYADTYSSTKDVFPTERFYMGGSNLRGFDQRFVGPSQFDNPIGGQVRVLGSLEYQFPMVSTRLERHLRETEILRGVLFTDFGMLGLDLDDDSFTQPRVSVGFGVRIHIPVLEVPVQLDLGWPIVAEQTDRERQLFLQFRRF